MEDTTQTTEHEILDVTSLGEGVRLTSTDSVELTKEYATEILELADFPGERPLRQRHVDRMLDAMRRGTFRWEWVSLITCRCKESVGDKPAGTLFRMNGQHTCWARIDLDSRARAPVKMLRYTAQTEQDVRQLYASIDRGAARTKAHVIGSYLIDTDEFTGIKKKTLSVVAAGMARWLWESKDQRMRYDGDDIAFLMLTEHLVVCQTVCKFMNILRENDHRHLFRAPVAAAMLAMFSKVPTKAAEFWQTVADGTGFERQDDARLRLRNYLMTTGVDVGRGSKMDHTVDQETMYRACLTCWNAWRKDRTLRVIRNANERPIVL